MVVPVVRGDLDSGFVMHPMHGFSLSFMGRLNLPACLSQIAKGGVDSLALFGVSAAIKPIRERLEVTPWWMNFRLLSVKRSFLMRRFGILGALHQPLLYQPFDQLAGGRGTRVGERADL